MKFFWMAVAALCFTFVVILGMISNDVEGFGSFKRCEGILETYAIYRDDGEQMDAKVVCKELKDLFCDE